MVDQYAFSLIDLFIGVALWGLAIEVHEFGLELGNFLLESFLLLLWSLNFSAIDVGLSLSNLLSKSLFLGLELTVELFLLLSELILSFLSLLLEDLLTLLSLLFLLLRLPTLPQLSNSKSHQVIIIIITPRASAWGSQHRPRRASYTAPPVP